MTHKRIRLAQYSFDHHSISLRRVSRPTAPPSASDSLPEETAEGAGDGIRDGLGDGARLDVADSNFVAVPFVFPFV